MSLIHISPAATRAVPAWVATSNGYAQHLLAAQLRFQPESATFFGVPGYDDKVADLGPDNGPRLRRALTEARATLMEQLRLERDHNVRQDLEIMIAAADDAIEASEVSERLQLPWTDAPQVIFGGLRGLLSDQTPAARRARALDRLKAYVGMTRDGTPLTTLARQRYEERAGDTALLRPTKLEVEQALANADTYAKGIRELFAKYRVKGSEPALKALDAQIAEYTCLLYTSQGMNPS